MHDPDPKKEKGPIERVVDALAGFIRAPVSDESNEIPDRKTTEQVAKAEGVKARRATARRKPSGSKKRAAVSKKRAAVSKKRTTTKRAATTKKRVATKKRAVSKQRGTAKRSARK